MDDGVGLPGAFDKGFIRMTTVLVIGGSRGIGLETVRLALESGFAVRAMARSVGAINIENPKLERVAGDATNLEDVERALGGVDAVVSALGIPLNARTITQPTTFFSKSADVLASAMTKAETSRLIAVTGYGAGDCGARLNAFERVPFRLVFGRIYDDKSRQEAIIKASGLEWTIARPGVLTRGARSGRYRVLNEPTTWRNGMISRADVADYIVSAISDRATIGSTPVLIR